MSGSADWRISEGPAIGIEPEFELSDIRLGANFFVTGGISRSISASLTTSTPTLVESLGRTLPELFGQVRIFDSHPEQSYPGLYQNHFESIELGSHRGVLALVAPDWFVVHLYLPPDQFAMLLSLLTPAPPKTSLRIEIERSLDQGLLDLEHHFWNDHISPVILFNEFEFGVSWARRV